MQICGGAYKMHISQYEVCIVDLNPTKGSEMHKIRPCVVLSPSVANKYLRTIIVAPVTSRIHRFKFRVQMSSEKVSGEIALDQIRAIDKSRITKIVGNLDSQTIAVLKSALKEFLVD
jgi:mRNA interferase MazF